ncbi:chitinase-3-like protein 1 [Octopus sinensis]|uniref:Chitinase-3-like protein 1 n=1 Tax=Octopus sinensis TaxID=2607531 RepID=A0A6P7UAR9_9MOLL|nr:chitinase-3-like protein 1 [Octopus sinensis]XP_036368117.1 chitinase-3-like protein 1 [Octopus sinensis]
MLLSLIICLSAVMAIQAIDIPNNARVWCYYTNWSQYRPTGMKYTVKNMDASLCTHIAFGFAILKDNKIIHYEYNDINGTWTRGMYWEFNQLKKTYPRIKSFLSVGGWNFGSVKFSNMASTPASRKTFVDSAVDFLKKWEFDGLDVDWEYPALRQGSKKDIEYYTLLLKELHEKFSQQTPRLLLSFAGPAPIEKIEVGFEVEKISPYVDFINIMTYDFHGSWETTTGHSSPLFPLSTDKGDFINWNMAYSVANWIHLGAPIEKINVGIPFYGRSFTLADPADSSLGAPAPHAGKNGTITRIAGFLSYFETCKMLQKGAKRHYIDEQKVPYLVLGDQWVGYEDVESVREKVHYLRVHGINGMMIWAIDLDDYKNYCNKGSYPMMHSVIKALQDTENLRSEDKVGTIKDNKFCFRKKAGFYADPSNCRNYIYCGSVMEKYTGHCNKGHRWNDANKSCEVDQGNTCTQN